MLLISVVSAECDPFAIKIIIFDDDKCAKFNGVQTAGAKISEEDSKNFNLCNPVRAGS